MSQLVHRSSLIEQFSNESKVDPIAMLLIEQMQKNIEEIRQITGDRETDQQNYQHQIDALPNPYTIAKSLVNCRVTYEVYLHQTMLWLAKQVSMFPHLSKLVQNNLIFQQKGDYPILNSWILERPLAVNFCKQNIFLTPQLAAYFSFMSIKNDSINPEFDLQSVSGVVEQINQKEHDILKSMTLIKNSHPFQNLISLIVKFPEVLLLIAQKQLNQTFRIGLFQGYTQFLSTLFIQENNLEQINSIGDKSVYLNIMPHKKLIDTSFSRIVICALTKSLVSFKKKFELWPDQCFYAPIQQGNYCLQDFLFSIAGVDEIKQWCHKTFFNVVQTIYYERSVDYFHVFCCQNDVQQREGLPTKMEQDVGRITSLVSRIVQKLISSLNTLPDIVKSTLTIAKIIIHNFVTNIVDKLFYSSGDQNMIHNLKQHYPCLQDLIDYSNHNLTIQRVFKLTDKIFQQFFSLFVVQSIVVTSFNNPVSYTLLSPSQSYLDKNQYFYSNLSFIIDLTASVFSDQSAILFMFQESILNDKQKQKYFSEQSIQFLKSVLPDQNHTMAQNFQSNFRLLISPSLQQNVKPFLLQIQQHDFLYQDVDTMQLFQTSIPQVNENQITQGFWPGTTSYFLFLYQQFAEHYKFINDALTTLDNLVKQIFTQFYQTNFQSSLEQQTKKLVINNLFQQDQSLSLFKDVNKYINYVYGLVSNGQLLTNFLCELKSSYGYYSRITIIPFFNDVSQQRRDFESVQAVSQTLTVYRQLEKTTKQQFDLYKKQAANKQSGLKDLEEDLTVRQEIKQFFAYDEQRIHSIELIKKQEVLMVQIANMQFEDEDELLDFVVQVKRDLRNFSRDTQHIKSSSPHYQNDVKFYEAQKQFLDQLHAQMIDRIATMNNEQAEQVQPMAWDSDDKDQQQYEIFQQKKEQFQTIKAVTSFDDMVMNFRQAVDDLHSVTRQKGRFATVRTIDRVYEESVFRPRQIYSNIITKVLGEHPELKTQSQYRVNLESAQSLYSSDDLLYDPNESSDFHTYKK